MAEKYYQMIIPLRDKLFRFSLSIIKDEALASDIVQETMEKLWNMREKLDDIDNMEAFTMRMIRNRTLDEFRYHKKFSDQTMPEREEIKTPLMQVSLNDEVNWLDQILHSLNAKQREVFHLREVEQMPYEEIASTLDISLANVKAIIHRTRKLIRKKMTEIHAYGT